ncbi:hypothetical protein NSP_32010 [Nodularia spumigena CCY9414]|nr:hypothetical protein NSP_32010 [Nodularia spumigena CCY9414]
MPLAVFCRKFRLIELTQVFGVVLSLLVIISIHILLSVKRRAVIVELYL